ncbi:DUF1428 domain-containing protein [Arsenicitalea aurantiaca]|uniref:DUF1428 domain-containing protein n=1 Tax=Arsenicitalea aurantiaca TaxID=1783274 RepID=A0A433XET4_9HYPH|nr:DUF1428 domain-containing protein [Arsenicitalea aurantiaca]RUT32560.1 DUF1428 domain-containing protein [Arsenicitalea aurantiaca]
MGYVEGFIVAVPAANKALYKQFTEMVSPAFREHGATRMVETWGDDVPEGEITDFRRAVNAKEDEVVLFSWIEFPSRAERDVCNAFLMSEENTSPMGDMPFDGQRMVLGGFETIIDESVGGKPGYVDGSVVPVPVANKQAYIDVTRRLGKVLMEAGALRVVDAWGDDVPDGKVTDFRRAVKAKDDETVVFTWIEWASKAARDAGWEKAIADPRLHEESPFDDSRRINGGFVPLVDL